VTESMAEQMARIPQAEPPQPRDSALGMLLRRDGSGRWQVLFGLRARRSRFMPGHLAFPGGRMEPADEPAREGAFRRCASREFAEESGIVVEPGAWADVGERVTPPLFPLRYRTRFFVAEMPAGVVIPEPPPRPQELERLRLASAAEALDEWRRGDSLIPPPALPMLRAIDRHREEPLATLAKRLREANALEERFPRIEFEPDVWLLPVRTRTIPPATHTNVWMPGGERFLIVDPGSAEPAEIERLRGVVERRRDLGSAPAALVLTHHHPDHVGGAAALARETGLPVWAHPRTLESLGLPAGVGTRGLDEGDVIDLEGMRLRVLHTPGHAAGHLALEIERRGSLIAGDLLSGLSTILVHPSEGDMEAYLASLARVRDGGYRRLLPAHGPPLPGQAAARVIEHRRQRERRVHEQVLSGASALADIARGAYDDAPDLPAALFEGQTLSHLLHLERQGRIRREGRDGARWRPAGAE